ncbi:LPS export ABC transporter periplasmic protein LptC [Roseobacteraceae bacterium NS-SX3]
MDWYSRMVAYLKVLLPLTALVLLSTLFLISRGVNTDAVIPFAEQEIAERTRGQQITSPHYSGTTEDGDEITVTAASALPGGPDSEPSATDLEGEIRLSDGGRILMFSDSGILMPGGDTAEFTGNVQIISADGLRVETEALTTALKGVDAESPGPVHATGPMGELTAGNMRIRPATGGGPVHMLFNNGVKLIYDPQKPER